ncbi:tetratricopeptide repeat protein [Candidatus Peregrinibacteria bacterium]|nr:tetratricopeptide repeat protein [Candidatus Peregrinibacteria bacterium]
MPTQDREPFLTDYDEQLTAMTPEKAETAVMAVEDRERILECLSAFAPFTLVEKFVKRLDAVSELVEAQFSIFEKGRIADAQGDKTKAKELYTKAFENGMTDALINLASLEEENGRVEEALVLVKKAADMGSSEAKACLEEYYKE